MDANVLLAVIGDLEVTKRQLEFQLQVAQDTIEKQKAELAECKRRLTVAGTPDEGQ